MNPSSLRALALVCAAGALVACSSDPSRYAGSGTTASGSPIPEEMSASASQLTEPPQGAIGPTPGPDLTSDLQSQQVDALAQEVVGMNEVDAINQLESNTEIEMTTRVVHRDGEDFPATTDYSPNRVNLWIDGGKVSKVSVG